MNTTSEQAKVAGKSMIVYAATKGAISSLTVGLSNLLAADGIRVNAVAPGPIWTPIQPIAKSPQELEALGQDTPRLGPFFESSELWTTEIAISHQAFPILLFFRSNDSRCEWLAALGAVLDAAALFDASIADPPVEARAGAHFVLRTGARVLANMAAQFGAAGDDPDLADVKRFDAHCDRLSSAGYQLVDNRHAAFEDVERLRRTYAGSLVTLARRLRIVIDERTGKDLDSKPHG